MGVCAFYPGLGFGVPGPKEQELGMEGQWAEQRVMLGVQPGQVQPRRRAVCFLLVFGTERSRRE